MTISGCAYTTSNNIVRVSMMDREKPIVLEATAKNRPTSWKLTMRMPGVNDAEKLEISKYEIFVYLKNVGSESIRAAATSKRSGAESHQPSYQSTVFDLPQGEEVLVFKGPIGDLMKYSRGVGFLRGNRGICPEKLYVRFKFISEKSFELQNGKIIFGIENSDSI